MFGGNGLYAFMRTRPPMNKNIPRFLYLMKTLKKLLMVLVAVCGASLKAEEPKTTNSTPRPAIPPAVEVSLGTDFASVDQFVESLKAFDPGKVKNGVSDLFSSLQIGQPDDNDRERRIYPDKIKSVEVLSHSDKDAVVFAVATPYTEACPICVGVLFSLSSENGMKKWRILDTKRFDALGKYADVSAKRTSAVDHGYDQDFSNLVISVKVSEGGRGESSSVSGSFRLVSYGRFSQISLN